MFKPKCDVIQLWVDNFIPKSKIASETILCILKLKWHFAFKQAWILCHCFDYLIWLALSVLKISNIKV